MPRLRAFVRKVSLFVFVLVLVACAGGSGASSCGSGCGMKPIPGGYPKTQIVDNAAAVRITRPGLDFLGENAPSLASKLVGGGSGDLSFEIPSSEQSQSFLGIGVTFRVCPAGPKPTANPPECVAEISLGKAKLRADSLIASAGRGPALRITGTIPVRVRSLPANVTVFGDVKIGVGEGQCQDGAPNFTYKDFPLEIVLPLVRESTSPRDGYMKVDLKNAIVDPKIDKADIRICKDCLGIFNSICDGVINWVKDLVFDSLVSGVKAQLVGALEGFLCTKPDANNANQCPEGSKATDPDPAKATCNYTSKPDTCVPKMLGTDGNFDLGGLLGRFSPGTQGTIDFLFAAGGDMDPAPGQTAPNPTAPTPNGATLPFLGGATAAPDSPCVPAGFENPPPRGIPVPDELRADKPSGWPGPADDKGPHVNVAISGRFLNYAFGGLYKSGALCLGVTTDTVAQLNSGLLSALIPSLKNLAIEQKPASIAIATRPSAPPQVTLGGGTDVNADPLIKLALKAFSIDFYVWTYDRYARAFTYTADVTVPINLTSGSAGLQPTLGKLVLANPKVTNSDALLENPELVANGLTSVVAGFSDQLLGAIPAFDPSTALASFGLKLTIPENAIRKLKKDQDDYLGVFGKLEVDTAQKVAGFAPELRSIDVDRAALTLAGADRGRLPTLHVALGAAAVAGDREVAWALDEGARSAWAPAGAELAVQADYLFYQGKHRLKIWSRAAGRPLTEAPEPQVVPFVLDVLPPEVRLARDGDRVRVRAWDYVSDDGALVARTRTVGLDGVEGAWSAWAPARDLAAVDGANAARVEVEVRDEEGNVGRAAQALVRGRNDSTLGAAGAGCGCATPGIARVAGLGPRAEAWLAAAALIAGLAAAGVRRRSRAARGVALGAVCAMAAASQGCSCGDDGEVAATTGCGADCNSACDPGLPVGIAGAYLSVAKAKDGTVWVAGYNDAAYLPGESFAYGDLVVGKWDQGKQAVQWTTVDGLPPKRGDGTCPTHDPKGWRAGETDSGDNVGLWTSVAIGASDRPLVAYYDATHAALKMASWNGITWATHQVRGAGPNGESGRYAKLLVVDGKPVLAFLAIEKGNGGRTRAKVVIARGKIEVPAGEDDWAFEDAGVDEQGPCKASTCEGGQQCLKASGACQAPVAGCAPACAAGEACVPSDGGAACAATAPAAPIESYPNAFGAYVSLANGPRGLGLVVYDRVRGNLVGLARSADRWTSTILAGEIGARSDGSAKDTGDVGIGASLAIDGAGDWHVSYANGTTEALEYVLVKDGKPSAPEVVDDGTGLDGKAFADGKHVVGDDSSISIDGAGTVTVVYQDATAGTLRIATGIVQRGAHRWTVRVLQQPGRFAGFFPQVVPGSPQIANFWRAANRETKAIDGNVAFVAP